ncbi:MAG: hypothetical protein Q8K60_02200, partial [Parachlamydiaceae bacterium]|nr:hypothetical protein [Parachlamydiaceae bacterium]
MSYIQLNNLFNEPIVIESVDVKPNSKNSTLMTLNGILNGLELGKEFQNKTEYQNIKEVSQAIFNQYQTRLGCKKYFYKFIGLFFTTNLSEINDVYNKIIKLYEKQKIQSIILEWTTNSNLSQEKLEKFNNAISDYLINGNQIKLELPEGLDLNTLPDIFNLEPFSSRLKILSISQQKLTKLPPSIFTLHSLGYLNLQYNNLQSLPPEIGNLKSLRHLFLSDNHLQSLPSEIDNLKSLVWLSFSANALQSLPPQICNLKSLKLLFLTNNHLESLPPEIGNLKSLSELKLDNNVNLTQLPQEICRLPSDCQIHLEACGLSQRVLQHLRETCDQEGYNGPHFSYSMALSFKIDPHNIPSISSILEDFFEATGRPRNTFPQFMEFISIENQSKDSLKVWLYRLKEIADLNRPKSSK